MIPNVTLAVRLIIGAVIALVLVVVFGLAVHSCSAPARQAAVQAHVDSAQAQGRQQAATDAVGVVVNQSANETAEDTQTRENHDKIVAAPGAQAPVDSGVNDAGLRALCLRHAYRDSPRCRDLLNAHP